MAALKVEVLNIIPRSHLGKIIIPGPFSFKKNESMCRFKVNIHEYQWTDIPWNMQDVSN